MFDIIVGNVCSFGAMIANSVSGSRKKRGEILGIQIVSFVFYGAGSFILKGYSSTVQNAVGILRNVAAIKGFKNKTLEKIIEWTLVALGVILGVVFNNRGVVGLLPVVANLEYSVAIFRFKNNGRLLKYSFIVNLLMYTVFSAVIQDYVSIAANLVAAVVTAVSLVKERSAEKNEEENEEKER